jgi:signal transduction histidine kinase
MTNALESNTDKVDTRPKLKPISLKQLLTIYVTVSSLTVLGVIILIMYQLKGEISSSYYLACSAKESCASIGFDALLESALIETILFFLPIFVFIVIFFSCCAYFVYVGIHNPLKQMQQGAIRFSRGNFDRLLPRYRIRELTAISQTMNRLGGQLDHLETVRKEFVANVSHELKTPITSIQGFVETLLEGAMDDRNDLTRFLAIIRSQSNRLGAIIEDLLVLARLESEQTENSLSKSNCSLRGIFSLVEDFCALRAQERGIQLEIDCDDDCYAYCDDSLVAQAISNLVDNAIKYSPENTRITLSAFRNKDVVSILVRDQGPGIEPAHLPRLFERFYRTDKARSREQGGTGLGLSIVKHIVSAHGGRVGVESEIGKGTTFKLNLPVSP